MAFLIDLIVIAVIAIIALVSAKHGFIKVFVQAVGYILAGLLAVAISLPLANVTYDKVVEKPIVDSMVGVFDDFIQENKSTIEEQLNENNQESLGEEKTQEMIDDVLNKLPDFLPKKEIKNVSTSVSGFAENITTYMSEGAESMAKAASQDIIKPLACKVLSLLYSVVMLSIFSVLINFAARILSSKIKLGRLEKYNRILGGAFGAVKGAIFVGLACVSISVIVNWTGLSVLFISPENLEKTFVFDLLSNIMLKFYK